jgi:carbonic anhydrase/acetyltransferase-like protein (isoleucine patch superfamily)
MKYELTKETCQSWDGRTLYRIKRISNGELGGFVEKVECLSQDGDAWVYGNAQVSGNARVSGNAWVYGNAQVSGNARVSGNALVYGNARVSGDARVYGNARVYGDAQVSGNALVYGDNWCSIGPVGSRASWLSVWFEKDGGIKCATGCWIGTLAELAKAVREKHKGTRHEKDYLAAIAYAKNIMSRREAKHD